jgi:soluble lytic murein transglycosylase
MIRTSSSKLLLALVLGVFVVPGLARPPQLLPGVVEHGSPVKFDAVLAQRAELILHLDAPHLALEQRIAIRDCVVSAALEHDVDPLLILALIRVESEFKPHAVSPKGAVGLMQVLPSTARWFAKRIGTPWSKSTSLFEVGLNVRLGVGYFAYLLRVFRNLERSLEAYNRGPGAVVQVGPDGDDERRYARRVLAEYRWYRTITACSSSACGADAEWAYRLDGSELAALCQEAARECQVL